MSEPLHRLERLLTSHFELIPLDALDRFELLNSDVARDRSGLTANRLSANPPRGNKIPVFRELEPTHVSKLPIIPFYGSLASEITTPGF
jgi:hypothetical protein